MNFNTNNYGSYKIMDILDVYIDTFSVPYKISKY